MAGKSIIKNIGPIVSGDVDDPLIETESILIENGRISDVRSEENAFQEVDCVIDAGGMTLVPGLIDSHVHPVFGEFTPRLKTQGWIESYLQGGVTSMISTGELHLPGRPHDPTGVKALAILANKSYSNVRPSGVKVYAGTLVLESGLVEDDLREVAEEGVRAVKFIQSIENQSDAIQMSKWAKKYGMKVVIHCGGTSLPDVPTTRASSILEIEPDILAHLNGGPTALPGEDIEQLVRETSWYIDLVRFGNLKAALSILEMTHEIDGLGRIILGTDSPTGSGMEPLGILHLITTLASLGMLSSAELICMATGNTTNAYEVEGGRIEIGQPADLVLIDAPMGAVGSDALESIKSGDIPAVAMVMIEGEVVVSPSRNTPPPKKALEITATGNPQSF